MKLINQAILINDLFLEIKNTNHWITRHASGQLLSSRRILRLTSKIKFKIFIEYTKYI